MLKSARILNMGAHWLQTPKTLTNFQYSHYQTQLLGWPETFAHLQLFHRERRVCISPNWCVQRRPGKLSVGVGQYEGLLMVPQKLHAETPGARLGAPTWGKALLHCCLANCDKIFFICSGPVVITLASLCLCFSSVHSTSYIDSSTLDLDAVSIITTWPCS